MINPNETLRQIRLYVRQMQAEGAWSPNYKDHAELLAEAVMELDDWLSNGGIPPSDWPTWDSETQRAAKALASQLESPDITGQRDLNSHWDDDVDDHSDQYGYW